MVQGGCCPTCGYALKGLPIPGTCPECATRYQDDALLPLRAKPSAFHISVIYGWPLLLVAATFSVFTSDDGYAIFAWMFYCAIAFGVSALNGTIATIVLIKQHRPQRRGAVTGFNARLAYIGRLAVALFYILVVTPAVIAGGCTFFVFAAMSS